MKKLFVSVLILSLAFTAVFAKGQSEASSDKPVEYQERIVIANNNVFTMYDCQANNTLVNMHIFALTHQTLIGYDEVKGCVVPDLALSWSLVDPCTFEFKLDPNAKFTDGSQVKASDVIFTYTRAKTSAAQSGNVVSIVNMEAVDDTTVRITLDAPNVDFLLNLVEPPMSILSEKALAADPEEGFKIGSGAYSITEWVPGDHVVVTRKDNYWGEMPKTKEFEYRKVAEDSSRVIGLQAGDIDIVLNLPAADCGYIEDDPNCTLVALTGTQLNILDLNMQTEVMQDIRVRQAIAHAINHDDLITAVMEGMGSYYPTLAVPSCGGFNADATFPEYNPEKAKQLLKEAGYPNGLTIKSGYNGTQWKSLMEIVLSQLAEVGIKLDIQTSDSTVFTSLLDSNKIEATTTRWAFGPSLVSGWNKLCWTDGASNWAKMSDKTFENMLLESGTIQDEAKRAEMLKEIQQYLNDKCYIVPLYVAQMLAGTDSKLEGMTFRNDQRHDFTYAYIVK